MKYLLIVCTLVLFSTADAQEWVAYNPQPPTVQMPMVPSQSFSTFTIQQPRIVYQWVPQYVNQPVLVEQRFLLCKRYHWTVQPTVQWVQYPIAYP
jgi:hypothetical protein